ncbi:putative flavin-containing polyamine oxidase [Pterulicium gracile]|uniref:Amine oxidase n=1 Tax=Pterulicium gracile TaxID=1884261 RepID=A0A5C3QRE0_9AGAR|nr:putative flavin-containing polyamine oxidase [Pterula gracilis]
MRSLRVWAVVGMCVCSAVALSVSQSKCRKTKVLVLGAGITGITAAKTLTENGLDDFIILEYQDRVGGRAISTNFGQKADGSPYVVELGANWIQGLQTEDGPENPIWALTKQYKVSNTFSDFDSIETFDETGPVDYTSLFDDLDSAWVEAEQDAGYILRENLLDRSFRSGLSLGGWKPRRQLPGVRPSHAQAAEWWYFDFEYAFSPEASSQQYSVVNYNTTFYRFSEENNFVWDQRGISAMVEEEADSFLGQDDPRLLLNSIITNITYTPKGVTVHTTNDICFQAQYAICSFSLGVLQNDAVSFSPPLPSWKQTAIETFQMGTYTKIFLQFPPDQVFWNTSTQFFLYASPNERGWYPVFQSLDHEDFHPGSGILFATVVSDQAHRAEAQDDEVTKDEIMAVLRQMYPNTTIPEPIDFMYPRWSTTPWSYGSYSNWPVGVTLKSHQNLRANLDRLYFAGEAGHPQFFGFLHGGYFEGKEIGERVAGCVISRGKNCTDMARYERTTGTTEFEEYHAEHGWDVDSFEVAGAVASDSLNLTVAKNL